MCSKEKVSLEKKNEGCDIFWSTICVAGIIIPIIVLALLQKFVCKDVFPNWEESSFYCIILVIFIGLMPYRATRLYEKSIQIFNTDNTNAKKKEKRADWYLYSCAVLTIILISIIIHNTGGIKNSLMVFYLFVIPSAIAVAFRAKWGLILACFLCVSAIYILYVIESNSISEFSKWYNFGFDIYQIGLILILELKTNSKMEKLETKYIRKDETN
jgi:hypothetical protein